MEAVRINRNLLKILHKLNEDIDLYRIYVIARKHFFHRSGIFSLNELCDVLHIYYDYKSLHRRAGNRRKRFKSKLIPKMRRSILFRQCPDSRYIAVSERKILNRFNGHTKSSWYEAPIDTLKSKRIFTDFCIGMLLSGNKFRANNNIAKYCGCTARRIQQATSRNNKNEIFKKQYNYIEVLTGSYKHVERCRAEFFNVHGITSPKPYQYKDEWVFRLNAPNSYKSLVLSGVKGHKAQPTDTVKRKESWFVPVKEKHAQLKLFRDGFKRWFFNENVYNLGSYIQDHSLVFD